MTSLPTSITTLPQRWAAAWSQTDPEQWVSLYTPNATYTDHAFQFTRQGRPQFERHFNLWRTSNPDFIMTIDENRPMFWNASDLDGKVVHCSFRTINRGTFKEDLPTKKATGKTFVFIGVIDMVIERKNGLITQLDEWYTNNSFDEKEKLEDYKSFRT